MSMKYVHTNIVARDWRKLADFYINVFNCKPILPERDLSGEWIDKITNLANVRIQGIHLSLPGYQDGPTLEIFSYQPECLKTGNYAINQPGFAHIAFHVDNVQLVLDKLLQAGGSKLGELIKKDYENIGKLIVVYARDPEGNIVEIQNWDKDSNK